MKSETSPLQKIRREYQPVLPAILQKEIARITISQGRETESVDNQAKMKEIFPNTYGKPIVKFIEGDTAGEPR